MDRREIGPRFARIAGDTPLRGVAFYARGGDGRLIALEGDVEAVLGHPADSLRADPGLWERSLHPDDADRVGSWRASLDSGVESTLDYRVVSADGGTRWVRDTCVRRPGPLAETVGMLDDVGVERSLREQVKALEARIWKSQRMDSLGALAAGVAHDFNNLLTTILSSVDLLEDEEGLSAEGRSDLSLIRQAAARGGRMVRQILRFARRGETFSQEAVDLGRTVEDLRAILERSLGAERELRLRVATELPPVKCDPAQIEQVVLNLVVNARDAMPAGGSVEVRAERRFLAEDLPTEDRRLPPGEYVVLSVRDTGPGIPEAVRRRMFEPFFTTKSGDAGSGSGFGLSTVQRIVRGYGGGVTVESAVGEGAAFDVWLPVRDVQAEGLPDVAQAAPDRATGLRVLVVEDDPEVREALTRTLGRDGHAVVAVGNATEALRVFGTARPPFTVAVVDVALPDRSGRELAGALRRRAPGLAVVIASGYVEVEARGAGEVFLPKPFTPDQLREALARAVEEGGGGRGEPGEAQPHQPKAVQ